MTTNRCACTHAFLKIVIAWALKLFCEARCGEDAVKWCRTNAVDVVPMDMNMPGIGGLEATRKISPDRQRIIKVIALTVHTGANPLPASDAGWRSWLSQAAKRCAQECVSAIRSVYSGQRYIASDIVFLQQTALSQRSSLQKTETPFASLPGTRVADYADDHQGSEGRK